MPTIHFPKTGKARPHEPGTIRIVLDLSNLGTLPLGHMHNLPTAVAEAWSATDLETLCAQVECLGPISTAAVIRAELLSWLHDLGTAPAVASVAIHLGRQSRKSRKRGGKGG